MKFAIAFLCLCSLATAGEYSILEQTPAPAPQAMTTTTGNQVCYTISVPKIVWEQQQVCVDVPAPPPPVVQTVQTSTQCCCCKCQPPVVQTVCPPVVQTVCPPVVQTVQCVECVGQQSVQQFAQQPVVQSAPRTRHVVTYEPAQLCVDGSCEEFETPLRSNVEARRVFRLRR